MVAGDERHEFVVAAGEEGERIDRLCAVRMAAIGVSRSSLAAGFASGEVTLDDRPVRASTRVKAGQRIRVAVPAREPTTAIPEDIPLPVLYRDEAMLVVDKPAGMVVHPARGHARGTLVNAVLFHTAIDDDPDRARPGIVHRLDKGTSGVMVVARTVRAREALKVQFQEHTIERSYLAVTEGVPPDDTTYHTLHGRHPTDRLRFTTRVREGRAAVTHVHVLDQLAGGTAALVRCTLETGRTHQIRVHLSEAGFPVLGDPLYGRVPRAPALRVAARSVDRQALHAQVLGLDHPVSGERRVFRSELPPDLAALVAQLRALGR